ncbi:MAG: 7-cyano-7-deazaguanine synthase QueC [Candidatus Omnitrophota bacterium]
MLRIASKKKAVVLLSGGLDSATTLYFAKSRGYECDCLIFDYGQRHKKEIRFAKKIAQTANCKWRLLRISLPWKNSALLDKKIPVPKNRFSKRGGVPVTYVPARNITFLSFALSLAEAAGAKKIFIGANAIDYSGYPDCRPQFISAFEQSAKLGTKQGLGSNGLKIEAPLINKTKAQIVNIGRRLGVPHGLTWSCYEGNKNPCGECDPCLIRKRGFRQAGIKDPLIKK